MLPIGPLMIEHRLIERMIRLMKLELENMRIKGTLDVRFFETAVDFIRTYADRCHHGKEEDILFRDLQKKPLPPSLRSIMDELIQEHIQARGIVKQLVETKDHFQQGDVKALNNITAQIALLVEFYPKHIKKEDDHFFRPCMDFFDENERAAMLREFYDFDRSLIHEKYKERVETIEKTRT